MEQAKVNYETYLSSIWFKFLQPHAVRGSDGRFSIPRGGRPAARLLELPYAPADIPNTVFPSSEPVRRALRELCDVPRMSTIALAAMINEAVSRLPSDQAFVNVGLWRGFTFLSGMACNEDKLCVGIDDFSWFEGPEELFRREFEARKSSRHSFHVMDYREYFSTIHNQPIGLYCYDGDHSYQNQVQALEIAEPYLADGCLILIDDPNWDQVRRATMDFIASSNRDYRVLMDQGTNDPEHPTLWNGVLMLQVDAKGRAGEHPPRQHRPTTRSAVDAGPGEMTSPNRNRDEHDRPLVSLVVHAEQNDSDGLGTTIETALSQSWPAVEVLIADERTGDSRSDEVLSAFEGSVTVVRAGGPGRTPALDAALSESRGDFVSVVTPGIRLRERAVHIGLATPGFRRAAHLEGDDWYENLDRLVAAVETILGLVPPGTSLILVQEGVRKLRTLGPLLEYPIGGGHPADDDQAIRDLETLREQGAGVLVFLWSAFWWLERYRGLTEHLRGSYRRVIENDLVIAFDLRQ